MEEKKRPNAGGRPVLARAGRLCRTVAAALIAGVSRRPAFEVEDRLSRRPLAEQSLLVGATLAALFLVSLLFAQLGWIGMLIFLLLVVLVVR